MPASLIGESVHLKVTYSVTTQELVSINQVLLDQTFTVTNSAEIAKAISFTFQSGGYPQTLSGTIGADIGSDTAKFSFNGTAQPGGLTFELTSIADESAQAVSSISVTNKSGFQTGINYFYDPTLSQNNLSSTIGLLGYQPGTNISETIKLNLVDRVGQVDTTPPDTSVVTGPASLTNSSTANFVFSATETVSKYQFSLDGSNYQDSTTTSKQFTGLSEGDHTLSVKAVDLAGNVDPTPASYAWTVDTTAPNTTFSTKPAALINNSTPTFQVTSNEAGVHYEASLDNKAFVAVNSSFDFGSLADGNHTVTVRAIDAAGNVDASPDAVSFKIDTTAPETTISSTPAILTNDTSAAFNFVSTEQLSSFEVSLDGGAFTAGSAPQTYTGLADGEHNFKVRAIDAAGNVDASPATYKWTVDTTAPDTSLLSKPGNLINTSTAVFLASSNDATAHFEAAIDNGAYAVVDKNFSFSGLNDGIHTVLVRAVDGAGNRDASPENVTFTIDTKAPETTIETSPDSLTNHADATFNVSSDDAAATFMVSLDGAAFTSATAPISYAGLADGEHTFKVQATDAAGNTDATPASYTWTVDTTAPITEITGHPKDVTNAKTADFTFATKEANSVGVTYEITLDNAKLSDTAATLSLSDLSDGSHTLSVLAKDAAGNVQASATTFTWTVDTAAPTAEITNHPDSLTNTATADFVFATKEADAAGVTYEITLDNVKLQDNGANLSLSNLGEGDHTLSVVATDAAGNTQAAATTFAWTVDTIAPDTTILKSPIAATFDRNASFTFDSTEHGTHFQVSLDGGAYVDAADTFKTVVDLGAHSLLVRAVDDAGNADATPAAYNWKVVPVPADPSDGGSPNPSGGQGPGGTDGTDIFTSGPTNEGFNGGGGTDYVVFSGKSTDYTFTIGSDGLPSRISGPDGTDTLVSIERLKFTDGVVAFDNQAAQVYRLYEAALDRAPETAGLSFWVHQLDTGAKTLLGAASDFLNSKEFTEHFGDVRSMTGEKLVQTFYQNILGRAGETAGAAYWQEQLSHGLSTEKMLLFFSESAENQAATNTQIVGGIHLDNTVFPVT